MKEFKHVVLTRFNYPEGFELIEERLDLFKKYTLKSMNRQTCKNFTWVFFTENDLDIDFENKVFIKKEDYPLWKKKLSEEYEYIIETRLDNDDIIHPGFIQSIQSNFIDNTFVLDFSGYRYDLRDDTIYEDKLYSSSFTSPFLSLISKLKDGLYVFDYNHREMGKNFKTIFKEQRLWIQMIHNSNKLMNKDSTEKIARKGRKCNKPDWLKDLE